MSEPTPTADDPSLEELVSRAADDFLERLARGERIDAEEHARRYPAIAAALRRLLPALVAIDRAGRAAADGPGAAPLPPGPPGYALLGELGRGGMGVVYRARQLSLGRVVALKVIRAGALAGAEERARFRAEAEAAARLRHANVVQVYEVGEHDGLPYLALEYCPGGSLADALAGTPLPAAAAARLAETLAGAVEAAHRERVVHRDLKPANVLLAGGDAAADAPPAGPEREAWFRSAVPKVTDFGLAKRLDEPGGTQSGAILGTPGYVAPEQAAGKSKEVGPAADVYALGALLYECLTGRPPFQAATPLETLLQVLDMEPVPPRLLRPQLPRDLETICLKCLEKDPGKRYASAAALADDLRRFQEGRPVAARPVGAAGRLARWARRRPAAALAYALTLVVAVVGGLGGGAAWLWRQAEQARGVEEKARTDAEVARGNAESERTAAEEAKGREETARAKAETARGDEETARKEAEKARRNEKTAREELARVDCLHRVNLAQRYWQDNGILRCRELLSGCPEELRQWEWHYLNRLTNGCLYSLPAPEVAELAFSPDGKYLVTGGGLIAWDARTGAKVAALAPPNAPSGFLAFSPDGKRVAAAADGGIKVCAVTGEERPVVLDTGRHHFIGAAFSADGQRLTALGADRAMGVWDTRTGRKEKEFALKVPSNSCAQAAFGPDGTVLAVGFTGGVSVFDAGTGVEAVALEENTGNVTGLAFSPDGKLLAAAVSDTVQVWDARTGRRRLALPQPKGKTWGMAFSPDGKRLAFGGRNGMVCVCDAETGKEVLALRGLVGVAALSVAFSPDGTRLAAGGEGEVKVWDADAAQEFLTFRNGEGSGTAEHFVALSADGKRLASFLKFSTQADLPHQRDAVKVWDVPTGKEVRALRGGGVSLALRPDGRRLVLTPGFPALWDVDTGRPGIQLQKRSRARYVTFSADGERLAARNEDGSVQVWEARTGREVFSLPANPYAGQSVALSPDGTRLATGQVSKTEQVRVWDVQTGRQLHALRTGRVANGPVLAFSADGRRLAAVGANPAVRVWDAETGQEVRSVPGAAGRGVTATAFSPDLRRIAWSGNADGAVYGTVTVLDVETGREALTFRGLGENVTGVAFSADGRFLAAASSDGTLRVWNGTPLAAAPAK
jgi:eukaryotic-like serine/threonine-protein kinase